MTTPTPDDFEERAGRWLAGQATPDPAALSAVHASIETLPRRRPDRFGRRLLAAAAVVLLVVTASAALVAREQGIGFNQTPSAPPQPPDPAAFAGDPRLALCGPQPTRPIAIFEMAHMSDYPRHFPNSYELTGLVADPNAPALVVISGDRQGGGRLPESSQPVETLAPGHHDLCIVVGADAATWAPIGVVDVDTTGFLAVLPEGTPEATPPDPAAFSGDARLKSCFEGAFPIQYVFEMTHARDYKRYLPAMGMSPELDVDSPAFVVVFVDGAGPFTGMGTAPEPDATPGPSPTPEPGRYVCVLVDGTPNLYSGVDITGMTVSPSAISSPGPSSEPTPTASGGDSARPTPRRPPGRPISSANSSATGRHRPSAARPARSAARRARRSPPRPRSRPSRRRRSSRACRPRGYERTQLEAHWARFEHRVDGRIKAILILTDSGPDKDPGDLDRRRAAWLRSGRIRAGRRSHGRARDDLARSR